MTKTEGVKIRKLANGKIGIASYEGGKGPSMAATIYPTAAIKVALALVEAAKEQSVTWSTTIPKGQSDVFNEEIEDA